MTRLALAMLVVSAWAAAAAAAPCEVVIARAPDDARAAIERWVEGEDQCATILEVRVIPTTDGLYVMATDDERSFDRVVPDAESAGALVASWAAGEPAEAAALRVALRVAPEAAVLYGLRAPFADEVRGAAGDDDRDDGATAPPAGPPRWGRDALYGAGYTFAQGGRYARVEIDAMRDGRWSFGAAGHVYRVDDARTDLTTTSGAIFVAFSTRPAPWRLRGMVSGGLTFVELSLYGTTYRQSTVNPLAEASLMLSRQLSPRWALAMGPIVRRAMVVGGLPPVYQGDVGVYLAARVAM